MEEQIKTLKCKRGYIKATLTKFTSHLETVRGTEFKASHILARLAKVKESWSEFHDIHSQIEALQEDAVNHEDLESFEEAYFNAVAEADELLGSQSTNKLLGTTKSENISSSHAMPQMPRISLPTFIGNFEEWIPFCEMFTSLVESNSSLSDVQKFHYLKSSLKGEAAECIQDLVITADNYKIAWAALRDRFDNKKLIIRKHILSILDLPTCSHENSSTLKQIVNGVQKHVRALKALNRPTEHWDDWLVCVISNKLDRITNKEWESTTKIADIPTYAELIKFLTHKLNTLETSMPSKPNKSLKPSLIHVASEVRKCYICKGDHYIYSCQKFLNMPVNQRVKHVKEAKLRLNCLRIGHQSVKCNSGHCKECKCKHNTLLHISQTLQDKNMNASGPNASTESPETIAAHSAQQPQLVLLSTASIQVSDSKGQFHLCRALLDSGSQSNFISRSIATKLGLEVQSVNIPVVGISQARRKINKAVSVRIKSRYNSFSTDLNCLVIENITNDIPANRILKRHLKIPNNLNLADPDFGTPKSIDMLIGAQLFWHLLCIGQVKLPNTQAIMQKTQLGWIVSGSIEKRNYLQSPSICNVSTDDTLEAALKKFWELEEVSAGTNYTPEEAICENHFNKTHKRSNDGRLVVELPFKVDPSTVLGDSRQVAVKRFYSLERKLLKQPTLRREYTQFMNEYIYLGHMQPVEDRSGDKCSFYLPHHAVVKHDSLTTKVRVVFDGSAKSQTGYSLNDTLMVGPTIQQDLFSIVCRFRTHNIVLTADITKMYRQVLVDRRHTRYQRILWRSDPQDEIQSYELNTVTYGTASASFLATRALKQIALDSEDTLPVGSQITLTDFYVDDLLTGAGTAQEIETIFKEVNAVLKKRGFELRKWACSNSPLLRKLLPDAVSPIVLNLDKNSNIKTLGVQWNPHADALQYNISLNENPSRITKRSILSQVAQIFDPLGLLGPVVVRAKLFMQTLWQLKISWDESLPASLHSEWRNYYADYVSLNSITVERNVLPYRDHIEIHGFCDASEKAYGACIYVRCRNNHGDMSTKLLCSKSRVAPLKVTTIPRLELSAAMLLAQLMDKVKHILHVSVDGIYYWTDSTIVLAWINTTSRQLKTFVANRVAEIQELSDILSWNHVSTNENSADLLSRGTSPHELVDNKLWWNGPKWLGMDKHDWPQFPIKPDSVEIPERRSVEVNTCTSIANLDLFERYSSLRKLQRIVGYGLRFAHNALMRVKKRHSDVHTGPLRTLELERALTTLVRIVQKEAFSDELHCLNSRRVVRSSSKLRTLNPFVDEQGLIRLGGRLRLSSYVTYNEKHPIVLPASHPFTKLLIAMVHRSELHAGTQATLTKIRRKFWPLSGRSTVRYALRNCITCFKVNPTVHQPIMGDLPRVRVEPARPFINVGIDYCGPFLIRSSKRRNAPKSKAYVAIFICMAVKAVHIEVVSGLDSDSFINALKRFISRRGMVANIYSDNGTNFVGARRELEDLRRMFEMESSHHKISAFLTNEGINWHFTPARAPHFGGIWEAAVKSFKFHFKRIIANALLTYEEACTVTTQIEAILNSRPLTPLSEDPSDLSILSPGHFLIGDSLRGNLEPNLATINVNQLSRMQLLENLKQHFWQRWSREYLQHLQPRSRWTKSTTRNLHNGQLVLIKEDNAPPLLWPLGRISAVHPGKDDVVRAVSVKTVRGEVMRPVNKLCPLRIERS